MTAVLLVDDDVALLAGMRRLLSRSGWRVACAESAEEAVAALERQTFDAVVTDLRMPGTDGTWLLAVVRERFPRTVRVVLTGDSGEQAAASGIDVAHAILLKPIQIADLRACVERLLEPPT
jgi:DNA-binding NtrC family response regulator